ncbi:5' nucleotidase, NT5C type [Heyndrickxia acidiproducens]|uniref:5' nucleotidase, NT5C type n=1 Tax=Heyndrickxia acidiproducens TaxID=1121084 RepID=UPI00037D908B|nr:HAD hydrolase-like protein [Heyndrickxia acidiproducens]
MIHIGLDFDDTLVDMRQSIVKILNRKHKRNLVYEDIEEYAVSNLYGYSFEEYVDFFTRNQTELHQEKPYPFLLTVLRELSKKAKLTIITGRPKAWMESAENWALANKLPIENIVCASQHPNGKLECALKHNISLFIEDNPSHALAIANNGIDVLLLDKPYNRNCFHERITRVENWKEIGTILLSHIK